MLDKNTGDLQRRKVDDLVPVAKRLLEQDDSSSANRQRFGRIPRGTQDALAQLVAAINETAAVEVSGNDGPIPPDQFLEWALEVCGFLATFNDVASTDIITRPICWMRLTNSSQVFFAGNRGKTSLVTQTVFAEFHNDIFTPVHVSLGFKNPHV